MNDLILNYALNNVMLAVPILHPNYVMPKHLKALTDKLNKVLAGEQINLCVSVPPRHGKSETLLAFIALYLRLYPSKKISYISYAQSFAESQALKSHNYLNLLGVMKDGRINNRKEWRTLEGGSMVANGVGGDLTGRGFDCMIIDDPVKDRAEAESLVYRNKVWSWFEDVAETRLEPNASTIVVMTRWHVDDLIGRILQKRNFEYLRIPALCDDVNDLNGRQLGEALWSERYDLDYLNALKETKPYTFSSMYQGLPQIKGSKLFKDVHFYTELPNSYTVTIGCDLAYSDKTTSDYSAVVVTASDAVNHYIIDVYRWQSDINKSISKLQQIQSRYNVPINLENNGVQKGIFDFVAKHVKLQAVKIHGDKYVRSLPTIELWNQGKIQLPRRAEWLNTFIDEVSNFTGVKDLHDDIVDALNYSIKKQLGVYVNY